MEYNNQVSVACHRLSLPLAESDSSGQVLQTSSLPIQVLANRALVRDSQLSVLSSYQDKLQLNSQAYMASELLQYRRDSHQQPTTAPNSQLLLNSKE